MKPSVLLHEIYQPYGTLLVHDCIVVVSFHAELLCQMFNELYDKELITEDVFRWWRDNGTENYGKGNCIQNTLTFFEWLDSASVESDEGTES